MSGYTVDDLDRLRDELGVAHLELDPWGSLLAWLNDDAHERAWNTLLGQAVDQLAEPDGRVFGHGLAWRPTGGTGYINVPDITVLPAGWRRMDELHFEPPPLLVVEVSVLSTALVDRTRKLSDYRVGGAAAYLRVDVPSRFFLHDFSTDTVVKATDSIELEVGGEPLRLSLP